MALIYFCLIEALDVISFINMNFNEATLVISKLTVNLKRSIYMQLKYEARI